MLPTRPPPPMMETFIHDPYLVQSSNRRPGTCEMVSSTTIVRPFLPSRFRFGRLAIFSTEPHRLLGEGIVREPPNEAPPSLLVRDSQELSHVRDLAFEGRNPIFQTRLRHWLPPLRCVNRLHSITSSTPPNSPSLCP